MYWQVHKVGKIISSANIYDLQKRAVRINIKLPVCLQVLKVVNNLYKSLICYCMCKQMPLGLDFTSYYFSELDSSAA